MTGRRRLVLAVAVVAILSLGLGSLLHELGVLSLSPVSRTSSGDRKSTRLNSSHH